MLLKTKGVKKIAERGKFFGFRSANSDAQLGRAMRHLNIEMIPAYSPQARGCSIRCRTRG
jgi:hypothetical protein